MSDAARQITSERAFFANYMTSWSVSLMSFANGPNTYDLWDSWLDACRAVRRARGLAPITIRQASDEKVRYIAHHLDGGPFEPTPDWYGGLR